MIFVRFRVSEEQIGRIQERRTRIKGLLNDLEESLRLVRELHKSSEVSEVWWAASLCLMGQSVCRMYAGVVSVYRLRDHSVDARTAPRVAEAVVAPVLKRADD